ncbi:type IV pilus modification PilV family protein [Thiocystis violacea]|uniref:type IV pilus modification PilV family protein n=1 Tax=Thiocystis violacea TaxID=13725 RepID=UPI00190301FE|nr:prepilin-type N-terminal cleavage/methylation domain-containing protein [Thiocystis violacea]MBK1723271.1 hypothetical protein [Thiocystis violacea]
MKTGTTKRRQAGFSLTEAMISLTVLTSGLLALAQFQGDLNQQSSATRSQTKAINLAQQKLEELRQFAVLEDVALVNGSDTPASEPGDNTQFRRHWVVTAHTDPDYQEVEVRAEWLSVEGEPRSTGVTTILTPGQPYSGNDGRGDRTLTPEASENEAPSPAPAAVAMASASTMDGRDAISATPQPRALTTCICTLNASTGGASLDQRNDNAACSNACCERNRPGNSDALCSRDACPFVAQCEAR